jgi:hypothetical protein
MPRSVPKKEVVLRREYLRRTRKDWPAALREIPPEEWPRTELWERHHQPIRVLRSISFLVQVFYEETSKVLRMSVCRTAIDDDGDWRDGITGDQLQMLKRAAGYGDCWAVEIYPPDDDLVDVSNMRHLWLLNSKPPFAWERIKN